MAPFGSSFNEYVKLVRSFNAGRRLTGRTKQDFEAFYEIEDPYALSIKLKHMVRAEIILDFVRFGEFRRVLDIGCGEGHLTATLAPFVAHIDAFDISEKAIERARRRGIKNVNFFEMDMRAVGNIRGTYDLIVCSESLYYTDMEERDHIVESVSRILSNDGVLLLSWLTDGSSGGLSFEYGLQLLCKHFRVVTVAPNWVSFARKLPWLVIVRAAIVLIVSKLAPRWRLVLWKDFTLSTPIERAMSTLYVAHKTSLRQLGGDHQPLADVQVPKGAGLNPNLAVCDGVEGRSDRYDSAFGHG